MNHRPLVFTTFLVVLSLSPIVFGASAVKAQRAKPGGRSEWAKTVQAAKEEGQVTVFSASSHSCKEEIAISQLTLRPEREAYQRLG